MTDAFSRERLARLHDVMAGYVDRGDVPGIVAAVSRHGQTHVEVLGSLTVGGEPMQRDTIFRISSMTKPVAAAAAMVLVEEGRLRLDDAVDPLLPELANRMVLHRLDSPLDDAVPAHRSITVRDLLTFRMGFGQVFARPEDCPILKAGIDLAIGMGPPAPATTPAPDEWLRRLGSLPLMAQPGVKWLYNTSADVLGVLIARAAKQPLEAVLKERIFGPLGMDDTGFRVPPEKLARFSTAYWQNPATGAFEVYDPAAGDWSTPPAFASAGGGLVSTLDDYLAFGRMMLNLGKHESTRVLSRPSVQAMTTDQLTPEQKATSGLVDGYFLSRGWGFGMAVVTGRDDISAVPGRYGWDGGMGTSWYSDPGEDLVGVLMTQRLWSSPSPPPVCRDFWTLAYAAIDD